MLEEKEALEKILKSCKSMSDFYDKLDELESNEIDLMVDSITNGIITIGVLHYKTQLSTVDNNGQIKLIVLYDAEKWHWYNIMPPEGFIFD